MFSPNKIVSNRFLYEIYTVYWKKIILLYILKDTNFILYRISFNVGCILCIIYNSI